jgi:site-specific DNA-methyltransferase (adenine-specific)
MEEMYRLLRTEAAQGHRTDHPCKYSPGDSVADFFCHSGTTLIAAERLGRRCFTCDIDPIFAEIAIRRLEHFRNTGKTGFQWHSPFPEISLSDLDTHRA